MGNLSICRLILALKGQDFFVFTKKLKIKQEFLPLLLNNILNYNFFKNLLNQR